MEVHDLTPGRYYVLFGRQIDEPAELGLAIGQLADFALISSEFADLYASVHRMVWVAPGKL